MRGWRGPCRRTPGSLGLQAVAPQDDALRRRRPVPLEMRCVHPSPRRRTLRESTWRVHGIGQTVLQVQVGLLARWQVEVGGSAGVAWGNNDSAQVWLGSIITGREGGGGETDNEGVGEFRV